MNVPDANIIARDEDGMLTPAYVHAVALAVENADGHELRALVKGLHNADLADLMELLGPDDRQGFIRLLGDDIDFHVLPELDETLRDEVLEELPTKAVVEAVRELESDDAVYLLEDMHSDEQQKILKQLPESERVALKRSLDYPEDSAGRLMRSEFVAVPPFWNVGQVIDYLRQDETLPADFHEVLVVDPAFHLLGAVALNRLLRTKRPVRIEDIMEKDIISVKAVEDQEQVAYVFEQYNLLSAPVVDEDGRVSGVVTIDDIVDVIQEEVEEDIHRLGGVGDEELTDTVWQTARGRFTWLAVNLLTAVFASYVISLFDASIEQMVALAVLMPIVASMGGNAGTQTMTVAVRALATHELLPVNAARVIGREAMVGLLNGSVLAILMGALAALWFDNTGLGLVLVVAMIVNMLVAALSGILIPLMLERLGVDPAIASSVFVTTVTDVVGFFAFLGLAATWLL